MKSTVLIFLLVMAAMFGGSPAFTQDDPSHPKVPERCDNYYSTPASHKCGCAKAKMCDRQDGLPPRSVAPDSKCTTYCIPSHCHCQSPCAS